MLHTIGDALDARAAPLLERLGLREPKEAWLTAQITRFEGERLQEVLSAVQWNPTADGIPTAMMMSFTRSTGARTTSELIAGFGERAATTGQAQLEAAHAAAVRTASADGATLAQYLMTVRNHLQAMPDSQLRRLVMVVRDELGRILLTRSFDARAERTSG